MLSVCSIRAKIFDLLHSTQQNGYNLWFLSYFHWGCPYSFEVLLTTVDSRPDLAHLNIQFRSQSTCECMSHLIIFWTAEISTVLDNWSYIILLQYSIFYQGVNLWSFKEKNVICLYLYRNMCKQLVYFSPVQYYSIFIRLEYLQYFEGNFI